MRTEFRDSREGRYRADPKRILGLFEHEYAIPIPDAEWKEMNRRAVDAVRRFLASPVYREIEASDPKTWLPFETLDSFDFEGTPVWAALDFIRRTPEGGAEVYDWKTGEERADANTLQLLCYALFVEQKHGVPASSGAGPARVRQHRRGPRGDPDGVVAGRREAGRCGRASPTCASGSRWAEDRRRRASSRSR